MVKRPKPTPGYIQRHERPEHPPPPEPQPITPYHEQPGNPPNRFIPSQQTRPRRIPEHQRSTRQPRLLVAPNRKTPHTQTAHRVTHTRQTKSRRRMRSTSRPADTTRVQRHQNQQPRPHHRTIALPTSHTQTLSHHMPQPKQLARLLEQDKNLLTQIVTDLPDTEIEQMGINYPVDAFRRNTLIPLWITTNKNNIQTHLSTLPNGNTQILFVIPVRSELTLWEHQSSRAPLPDIPIKIRDDLGVSGLEVALEYTELPQEPHQLQADLDRKLKSVKKHIAGINRDLTKHQQKMETHVSRLLTERKNRIRQKAAEQDPARDLLNRAGYKL